MIRIVTFIFIFFTAFKIYSQYDSNVNEYRVNIHRINDGYSVPVNGVYNDGETITCEFEVNKYFSAYQSPYTSFLWKTEIFQNKEDLWEGKNATISWQINYPRGIYELIDDAYAISDTDTIIAHGTDALYITVATSDLSLSVEMSFFEAVLINGDVVLTWITESEMNNYGYNIWRKEHGGAEKKINSEIIEGQGNTSTSTTYEFTDPTVIQGKTYTYKLESISYNGLSNLEGQFYIFVPIEYGLMLYQNYPNPVNPNTIIEFKIDEPSYVKLFIYDIVGRKNATVINKYMDGGKYRVGVDCSNMASGHYFYVLEAHNKRINAIRILTKKMTVIK